jgi:alpha-galactosidase
MSAVAFDQSTRTWLLSTSDTSYALQLQADDILRHLHWGRRLTLRQALAVAELPRDRPRNWESRLDNTEEFVVTGGMRFGVPSLQVRFADGTTAVEWRYVDHTVSDDESTLDIRFVDRHYPLEVVLHYRVLADHDVIERSVTLHNTSTDEPITVLRADSATWPLPLRDDYRLSHVVGEHCAETQLRRNPVPVGETQLTSRRGSTSHHANPWVMLDAGDAGAEHGEVWSAALAWSGTWRLTVQRVPEGRLSCTGGFGHDGISWRLEPGESLRTPVFAGLCATDGFGGTSRRWHRYIRDHALPHSTEDRPILYNSWEATGFDVNEDNQKQLAKLAAGLGVETFVMDDGWFGQRANDHAGLGDWTVNHDRFPNGLQPLIDEVHRLGMRFGLWVEPEMVNPDSDLYRQHPDWVLHFPHRRRSEMRNQLVLNFARDDVAEWAWDWLHKLLTDNEIDFVKWDMNRPFSEAGWPDNPDDQDSLWRGHVDNLYAILDRLRAAHPNLRIESCSSGGGRVDLGILHRTDQVWVSDNTDALDRLVIQHGFSQIYPARVMAAWVTDCPNFLTGRTVPLRFRFHVAMSGVLAVGGNLLHWDDGELSEATGLVAQYKRIRPVVQHGTQRWLRPPEGDGVVAVQYTDGGRTVVFVYRQSAHFGHHNVLLPLADLDPDADYRADGTTASYPGAVLLSHGLPVNLPSGDYASNIIVLDRVPAAGR